MKFTSIPESYSSFYDALPYTVDAEGAVGDIEIVVSDAVSGERLGTKTLCASAGGTVDIAPMLRSIVSYRLPAGVERCAEVDTGAQVSVAVTANGTAAPTRKFIAARVDMGALFTLLEAQGEHRTLAAGEYDLVSFFSMPDAVAEVVVEAFGSGYEFMTITPPSGGQRTVAVTTRGFAEVPQRLAVTLRIDGEAVSTIGYDVVENPSTARRVAWLDGQHAPEIYTFPVSCGMTVGASRRRCITPEGRTTVAVERDTTLRVVSAYEPRAQLAALAEIIVSPRVWLLEGDACREVDVLTDTLMMADCGALGSIAVTLRGRRKEARL